MAQAVPYMTALVRKKIAGSVPQKGGHMTHPTPIKASLAFKRLSAKDVVTRARAVIDGVYPAKEDYPAPTVDQPTLTSQVEALSAAITASLDGSRKAIATRDRLKEVVIKSLHKLGHYVEENCKDDMATFLKSGFQPATAIRTTTAALSDSIRKIVPGKVAGQMEVTLVSQEDAVSYQLRRAPVGPTGTPGDWIEQPVGRIKRPTLVTGLIPGTTYAFQVRAVTRDGYSDWSQSITKVCT
jgi:Fibronectin type III domain